MARSLLPLRFLFAPIVALALSLPAHALDDGELRRLVREAGLVSYWSFKPAPDFHYPDIISGRTISLADFNGRVVLVNGWATWCPPCVREMPSLDALHREFGAKGLVIIGINVRDRKNAAAIAEWLNEHTITFLNIKAHDDGPNWPSRFSIPQTFLIDRRGRLIANKSGEYDWSGAPVRALIRRLADDL